MMRVLILFLLFTTAALTAAPDTVIARVGNKVITAGEMRTRFEFSPQVFDKADLDKKKQLFLYTLIAEKLFALEAERNNADTSEIIRYTYNEIERMYLRDALFKLEITDKVIISEDELKNAASREIYRLVLSPYFITDSLQAQKLYKRLLNNREDDSSAQYSVPEIEVGFGELRTDIENAVYNLKKKEITSPLKYGRGWYIFRLKEKKNSDAASDITSVIKRTEKKLKEMKSAYIYDQFFNNFFSGRSIDADGDIFWSIVNKLTERFKTITPGKDGFKLTMDDVRYVEHQFGDSISTLYIQIDRTPLDIRSFMRKLYFQGFTVDNSDQGTVAAKLNSAVKLIIENELLTMEAYKKGLHLLPEVQESLRMWKDHNLSTVYTLHISDSLSGLIQQSDFRADLISLVELYTEDLQQVENILDELNKGKDFEELVRMYNRQNGAPETKGFIELTPASMLGEAGRIAVNLKEGDVYGPISVEGGYSVIKLLRKQQSVAGVSGDKEKSAAYSEYARNLDAVKGAAVELAGRYGISINYEALEKVSVTDHNMFTIRMMGFGGRIPAVPMVSPFYEWYELWQKSSKEVP